ncbi:hypothetical protein ACIVBQ_000434 [Tenacibaculum discolor]
MKLIKTSLALRVTCKCGGVVAASLIYGGDAIDEDFTATIAEIHHKGGKTEIIDTDKESVKLDGCKCKKQ